MERNTAILYNQMLVTIIMGKCHYNMISNERELVSIILPDLQDPFLMYKLLASVLEIPTIQYQINNTTRMIWKKQIQSSNLLMKNTCEKKAKEIRVRYIHEM